MDRMLARFLMMALLGVGALSGCGAVEEVLDGEAAELAEPDLPNCSRIITCCENLKGKGIAPDACDESISPAASTVIDTYQDARNAIPNNSPLAAEEARVELRITTQDAVEPGCRCFLEETVGQIDAVLLPIDCEPDTSTGELENAQCSDATDALIDAADGADE